MTVAPASTAICTAALPTPLAAALTSRVSPGWMSASRRRQYQADSQAVGSDAADGRSTASGTSTAWLTGTAASSA